MNGSHQTGMGHSPVSALVGTPARYLCPEFKPVPLTVFGDCLQQQLKHKREAQESCDQATVGEENKDPPILKRWEQNPEGEVKPPEKMGFST